MNTKRTLACAALLLGLLSFNAPLTAAVESDIVGYTTIEMKADKWYQVAFPFVQLDDTETVSISEAFNSGFVDGDTLMILNPQTGLYGFHNPLPLFYYRVNYHLRQAL